MINAKPTNRSRWIAQIIVVVVIAGVFFVLGRQSVRPAAEQTAGGTNAAAEQTQQLYKKLAELQDAAESSIEAEQSLAAHLEATSKEPSQPTVRVIPLTEIPGVTHSEWGQWPERPWDVQQIDPSSYDMHAIPHDAHVIPLKGLPRVRRSR